MGTGEVQKCSACEIWPAHQVSDIIGHRAAGWGLDRLSLCSFQAIVAASYNVYHYLE